MITKLMVELITPMAVKTMSSSIIGTRAYCKGARIAAKITAMTKKAATMTSRPAMTVDPPQKVWAITPMMPSSVKSTAKLTAS